MHIIISLTFSVCVLLGIFGVLCDSEDRFQGSTIKPLLPPCDSHIYCQGKLLHDVQMSKMFGDSKTFVDMKLKFSEHVIVEKYEKFRSQLGTTPTKDDLQLFVNEHFEHGDELERWRPSDFNEEPSLANKLGHAEFQSWVNKINRIFLDLSRKVKRDVKHNSERYSLLYVPNGFVIPGGRFTELYYWDSYWILSGLLLLDMPHTARGVIQNFFYLFYTHGIIPNGSRQYYLRRSQPPLLTAMVDKYYRATNDLDFVRENIDVLESEFNFWMTNHMVEVVKDGTRYNLARYYAPSSGPRPESYREDYYTAENLLDDDEKNKLFINLKSAAETGYDFSTRWIIKDGTNKGELSDTQTPNIIPVDLNSFLHYNALVLSDFYSLLEDAEKATYFMLRAYRLQKAIHTVLWHEDRGIWFDYDMKNNKSRDYFYLSNFTPLWTGSYVEPKEIISSKVLKYLNETNVEQFVGGLPTSLVDSKLQWDFPNGWPPLEAITIQGLDRLGTPEAKEAAQRLAQKWIRTNYKGFQKYHAMFEKYNVTTVGETGKGGEYAYQEGFGWTNGVILQLLDNYPNSTPGETNLSDN